MVYWWTLSSIRMVSLLLSCNGNILVSLIVEAILSAWTLLSSIFMGSMCRSGMVYWWKASIICMGSSLCRSGMVYWWTLSIMCMGSSLCRSGMVYW